MKMWGLLLLLPLASSAQVFASDEAKLVRSDNANERIEQLSWSSDTLNVFIQKESRDQPTVRLEGHFDREGWNLIFENRVLTRADAAEKDFSFDVPLRGTVTPLTLTAVGPAGGVEYEKAQISFESFSKFMEAAKKASVPKDFVQASMGPTVVSYQQSRVPDYSLWTVTGKVSYQHLIFPPKWDFAISAFGTLLTLASNRPDISTRYLGINLRIGYVIPGVSDPWRLGLMGGWYYSSMIVTPSAFGYKNLSGPQVFPVISRGLKGGARVGAYFKYSPIMSGLSVLSLSNRELALGANWTRPLKSGHPLSVSVDFANLGFKVGTSTVSSTSLSLSAGYGL
jgi:hypothetical protein